MYPLAFLEHDPKADWPWTYRDLPASSSKSTIMFGIKSFLKILFNKRACIYQDCGCT